MKKCLKYAIVFAVGIVLEIFLLMGAFLIPVNEEHKLISYAMYEQEGWYPRATVVCKSLDTYFHSFYPDVLDNLTDNLMLHTAMETMEDTPLLQAMDMNGYSRYWHGYVAILRPLLYLFDYSEIRVLNCICQLLLIMAIAVMIYRKRGWGYVVMLFTSYYLLMPLALPLALRYTGVYYVTMIGSLILIRKQVFFETENRYLYLFTILGMSTCFFDLLSYPLVTWGIPLIWWLVLSADDTTGAERLKRVVVSGLAWIAGYGINWSMKWILANQILGHDVFQSTVNRANYWLELKPGLSNMLEACYLNWKHYEYKIFMLILVAWVLWWCYQCTLGKIRITDHIYAYVLIASSSVVWYAFWAGQNTVHHFFTYRIWNISILAFMAIVLDSVYKVQGNDLLKIRKARVIMSIGWILAAILAILMVFTAREDFLVSNGAVPCETVILQDESGMEVDFSPTFMQINEFAITMKSEGQQGNVSLEILEDGVSIYEEVIAVSEFVDKTYYSMPVDWKFQKRHSYTMRVCPRDCEKEIAVLISQPDFTPLIEYSRMLINGELMPGQPISGMTYRCLPMSKKTLIFLFFSWTAVFVMLEFLMYQLWCELSCRRKKENNMGKC